MFRDSFPVSGLSAVFLVLAGEAALAAPSANPPVANTGGPYVAECTGATTILQLDGSASTFEPGSTFHWESGCPNAVLLNEFTLTPTLVVTSSGQCVEVCAKIFLTIHTGALLNSATTTVTVQDTGAPTLSIPGNVYQPWGIATTPGTTGTAVAFDACDPQPVVSFTDFKYTPGQPGLEQVIERTWKALDKCGNSVSKLQRIHLLGPSFGGYNLEADPSGCADLFSLADLTPLMTVYLGGTTKLDVSQVDVPTLRFSIREQCSGSMLPMPFPAAAPEQLIKAIAVAPSQCNPSGSDGRLDLSFLLSRERMRSMMGLPSFAGGPPVTLTVAGQRYDGSWFWAQTNLTIQ